MILVVYVDHDDNLDRLDNVAKLSDLGYLLILDVINNLD